MKPLTAQQSRFVDAYLTGLPAAEAARRAGFSESYSDKAAAAILKHPSVAAAVQDAQGNLRGKTLYDVEHAVVEIDQLIQFALSKNNAMAAAKPEA